MVVKNICKILLLPLMFCSMGAAADSSAVQQQSVDLVVVLSAGCEEILKVDKISNEPCCNELLAACKEDQIVIVSPAVLYGMLRRKHDGHDGINECIEKIMRGYKVYLNHDEDFIILIPSGDSRGLKELGFDESQVIMIEPDTLMRFSAVKWSSHLIEIDHFKKLFRVEDTQEKMPAKSIYLISHGIDALDEVKDFSWSVPLISSLTVWQFVNFLQMLNGIHTQFLHIASCYAAGLNFFNVERILCGAVEDERCSKPRDPLCFPLVIQGTTDSPVSAIIGNGPGCKNFFSLIRQWLSHDKDLSLLSEGLSRQVYMLKNIVVAPNFPLLKIAGGMSAMSLPVKGVAVLVADGNDVTVNIDERYLFIYPCSLSHTKLLFESPNKVPQCISKVVGRAGHFLGALQVPGLEERSLLPLLQECFLKEVVRNYDEKCCYGVSDKSWFIQRIISGNTERPIAKGVIVLKGQLKYGEHKALILYQDAQGVLHRVQFSLPVGKGSVRNDIITEHEYVQTAARIFWETRADESALSYATGGAEQYWYMQECLRSFLRTMDFSLPSLDLHMFVQEDLANIRYGYLKKEAYLNYVAYIHDKFLLNELVAACLQRCDVLDFCDIEKVLKACIDTEWHDASLCVVLELLRTNNVFAQQAALNTLIYMVSVGLYVHASKACQDILNCFDVLARMPGLNTHQLDMELSMCKFFAMLMATMVKENHMQAAELIINAMLQHGQWHRYGIGVQVCTLLSKQDMWELAQRAQPRLQWFAEDMKKHLAESALAVYFDQMHIVEIYMQELSQH